MMLLKNNRYFLFFFFSIWFFQLRGQNEVVVSYDYLSGEYEVLDTNYTGVISSYDTINGIHYLNYSMNLFEGKPHGRMERNVWISPFKRSRIPHEKEVVDYFHGVLHGSYISYEKEKDSLSLYCTGEYRNGKKSGLFLYYYNGIIETVKEYSKDTLKKEVKYRVEGRVLYEKLIISDSLIVLRMNTLEKEFNEVQIVIKNRRNIGLIFLREGKEVLSKNTWFNFSSFPWLYENTQLFILEIDFLKAFIDDKYFQEVIADYEYRRVLK
jgi:hypothetical protein